jgi:hypothetical protein
MKNNLLVLSITLLTIIGFSACQQDACINKEQFISSFDTFTQEIDKIDSELDEALKTNFVSRYKRFVNNCYKKFKYQMSLKEKQSFWTKSVKSYFKLLDGDMSILFNDESDDPFYKYVQDEIQETVAESGDDFANVISNLVKKELPNYIDKFIDEVGKLNENLKENIDK